MHALAFSFCALHFALSMLSRTNSQPNPPYFLDFERFAVEDCIEIMKELKAKSRARSFAALGRSASVSSPVVARLATPIKKKPAKKRAKLPSLAELKRQLAAGADTALATAQANTMRLIGRPRL
jgi:hypothetical protein